MYKLLLYNFGDLSGEIIKCNGHNKHKLIFLSRHEQVEKVKVTRHEEVTKAMGLVTIKAMIDKHRYRIVEVIDASTDKSYGMVQARRMGLIDLKTNEYVYPQTKHRISLDEAIDKELVIVDFVENGEENNNEKDGQLETMTYAINYVVDQKKQTKIPFHEAMRRGLIDPKTGDYLNNLTGEKTYLVDATRRGFLKGRNIEDARGLNIDAKNKLVVEAIGKIRKNVLSPISVITAFRRAAKQVYPLLTLLECIRGEEWKNIFAQYI